MSAASSLQALPLPDSPFRPRWQALWRTPDGQLRAALQDPNDTAALEALRFLLGQPVALLAPEATQPLNATAETEPAVAWIDNVLARLVAQHASDLHLEAEGETLRVRARQTGKLLDLPQPPAGAAASIVAHLKLRAALDPHERRRSQDGRFAWAPPTGEAVDFRLSCLPTHRGESLVLRILNARQTGLRLHQLGLPEPLQAALRQTLRQPNGLILAVGPTGSGKTTTLYALLQELDRSRSKVLTVEDPVEYALSDAIQVNVQAELGLGFSEVLRAMLRHDPDQILVGEIRDRETARISLQAALTGHLVLSSLHASDAPAALVRLRDLDLPPYLIAATVRGIVGQRLLPRADGQGRVGIFEWLAPNAALRDALQHDASLADLRTHARASGWIPLAEAAREAVEADVIVADQAHKLE
ncbi:MAG: GspE/PulE family protein [Verrucomicrobiota bacterium JB022]|nr:GspE/PulE family protein [Verrucomicrobiota bacterium JB022]